MLNFIVMESEFTSKLILKPRKNNIEDLLNPTSETVSEIDAFFYGITYPEVSDPFEKCKPKKMLKRERMTEEGLIEFLKNVPKLTPLQKTIAIRRYMEKKKKRNQKRPIMSIRSAVAKKKKRIRGKFVTLSFTIGEDTSSVVDENQDWNSYSMLISDSTLQKYE